MSIRIKETGYTIVEALIFLAVSSALAISALTAISGQQAKTEFQQAVKNFESQVRDIGNDVSTGYFPREGNIGCEANGDDIPVTLNSGASDPQGTNEECVVAGRLLHFESQDNIKIYNIIGRRTTGPATNENNVADIFEARTKLTSGPPVDISDDLPVAPILRLGKVTYVDNTSTTREISSLAFFSTFGKSALVPQDSGVITADILPISVGNTVGQPLADLESDYYSFYTNYLTVDLPSRRAIYRDNANPASGIIFCLIGQGVKRYALVTVGSKGAQASSTNVQIIDGDTCP